MKGFIEFIREQGVVGFAVAFILAASITKVVNALVQDIINPIIGPILGAAGSLEQMKLTIGSVVILWGSFAGVLIDFIIIAGVVYMAVKVLGLQKLDKPKSSIGK